MAVPIPIVEMNPSSISANQISEKTISLPSIAMKNGGDKAIVTFENDNKVFYCVGTISNCDQDEQKEKLHWSEPILFENLCTPKATELHLSINNEQTIIAAYRRSYKTQLYFMIGNLDGEEIIWTYQTQTPFSNGYSPVVSINNDGKFIIAHQSWFGRDTNFWIGNANKRDPGQVLSSVNSVTNVIPGCFPSVAINDKYDVIEVHETHLAMWSGGNALYYRVGKFKVKSTEKEVSIIYTQVND